MTSNLPLLASVDVSFNDFNLTANYTGNTVEEGSKQQ